MSSCCYSAEMVKRTGVRAKQHWLANTWCSFSRQLNELCYWTRLLWHPLVQPAPVVVRAPRELLCLSTRHPLIQTQASTRAFVLFLCVRWPLVLARESRGISPEETLPRGQLFATNVKVVHWLHTLCIDFPFVKNYAASLIHRTKTYNHVDLVLRSPE